MLSPADVLPERARRLSRAERFGDERLGVRGAHPLYCRIHKLHRLPMLAADRAHQLHGEERPPPLEMDAAPPLTLFEAFLKPGRGATINHIPPA